MLGGGGLDPGIYCCLSANHSGGHRPPEPVQRGRHPHPFARDLWCEVCDRCGQPVAFTRGHCEACARRVALGLVPKEKELCCPGCGARYAD